MEKYEKPGERLVSKVPNKEYKDNYAAVFGEKESWIDRRERERNMLKDLPEVVEELQEKKKHDDCTD